MPSLYNTSLCGYDLYLFIISSDNIFESNYINDVCLPLCPLECNQTLYRPSISSYQLIGLQYIEKITNNPNLVSDFVNRSIDGTTAKESFVNVNIFYERLSYIESTESPQMDFISLLGSMGGNLSLLLGVSVFCLCEFVEVAIEIFFILNTLKRIKPNLNDCV